MRYNVTQIRDLSAVLRDIAPNIANPKTLHVGRKYTNFSLLPREVLANWLVCAVMNFADRRDSWTFADDPTGGDGLIVGREARTGWPTEHVFIPKSREGKTFEDQLVDAVQLKQKKGDAYATGKALLIFSDANGGKWYPNRVGRQIEGQHKFDCVWAVGLQQGDGKANTYWVVCFTWLHSAAWLVHVNLDAIEWSVTDIQ